MFSCVGVALTRCWATHALPGLPTRPVDLPHPTRWLDCVVCGLRYARVTVVVCVCALHLPRLNFDFDCVVAVTRITRCLLRYGYYALFTLRYVYVDWLRLRCVVPVDSHAHTFGTVTHS